MTILLLLPLLQAAPGRSAEASAAAFADGDPAAREEILNAGLAAVLPLRKARARSPARVDLLLYELKKAEAKVAADASKEFEKEHALEPGAMTFAEAAEGLSGPFPLAVDPTLLRDLPGRKVTVEGKRSRRETLDAVCAQAGVDYRFFYDALLVSTPERLWPPPPPPPRGPLAEAERARAERWIEELGSDAPEERAKALRGLKELGTAAVPLLEKNVSRGDSEIARRCGDLLRGALKPPFGGVFRAPAAERQRLEGADAELAKALRDMAVSFKVQDIVASGALRLFLTPRQVRSRWTPAVDRIRITLDLQNIPGWALLSILCHAYGLDFMIEDGDVFVGTKDEIERKLAP